MPDEPEVNLRAGLEGMAAAFHAAWMDWSHEIVKSEKLSAKRLKRWKQYWVPYERLPEKVKEQDRQYARVAFIMLGMGIIEEEASSRPEGDKDE
jgi:hypothetical protein